jgi:AraC-like DNA-binding protein
MDDITRLENVIDYNEMLGVETVHPLVNVIDFSQCQPVNHGRLYFGFYAVFLKDVKCGDLRYGKKYYDYQEGTLVFVAPGQVLGVENKNREFFQPKGQVLIFHPDLIRGTSLGREINHYTFFSYETDEALHLSKRERNIVLESFSNIAYEIEQSIDKHSKKLIVSNIELFLNYCMRFYDRQFITRENVNKGILEEFENLLNDYFQSGKAQLEGFPYVAYFAEKLNLSPNYFGDLVKKETGKSAREYINLKLIHISKEKLFDTSKSVSEIAHELGFKYPQHFNRMFKSNTGYSPGEFRQGMN